MMDKIDKRSRAALLSERLELALAASGLSRAALAREIGVDRSTISQLLSGQDARVPNAHLVALAASVLKVSADWLLGLSEHRGSVGDMLAAAMDMPLAERMLVDEQVLNWHAAAEGYKIRHVPATLPDMLKTSALLKWDLTDRPDLPENLSAAKPEILRVPGAKSAPEITLSELEQTITAARDKLQWMRETENDYEIAFPIHELEALARGEGYYRGLSANARFEQLAWMSETVAQLYPTLRLFLFDLRRVYSAPITVYGPRMAVIYMGRNYIAFRDRERVQTMIRHFDWLVRATTLSPQDVPAHLQALQRIVE